MSAKRYAVTELTAPQLREINAALACAEVAAECGDDHGMTNLAVIQRARARVQVTMLANGVEP